MRKYFTLFFSLLYVSAFTQQKTLDYFIQQAVQNSPYFIENKNQVESLRYDSLRIRALHKPQVNFDNNNLYAPVINGFGYDNAITNGGVISALAGATIAFASEQNLSNQFQSIQLQRQSLQLSGKLSEKDLKKNITTLYITIFGEQEMLHHTEDILNVLQKENLILKDLSEQGVYHETDYLTFLVNYKQQELSYEQNKLQLQNDLAQLSYFCGVSDTSYFQLAEPSLDQKNALQSEQTLAFRQFMIDSLVAKNNYEKVKFDYKPHLNAFGDAGYNSSLSYQAYKNFGISAGLHLIVPLYDGGQRNLRYEKIKLEETTRRTYMQFFKKQFAQKFLQLQQQITNTGRLITEAKDQLKLSDALVQANRKLLSTGDIKMTDYILALTNYISAQSTIVQLQINEMQLKNELNFLNY